MGEQFPSGSPESAGVSSGERLLAEFRELRNLVEDPEPLEVLDDLNRQRRERRYGEVVELLTGLPSQNPDLARAVYNKLTMSTDERDRRWAATLYPELLAVDKEAGLALLGKLVGRQENVPEVYETAYETLTEDVASRGLLTLKEAVPYIDSYRNRIRKRWTEWAENMLTQGRM